MRSLLFVAVAVALFVSAAPTRSVVSAGEVMKSAKFRVPAGVDEKGARQYLAKGTVAFEGEQYDVVDGIVECPAAVGQSAEWEQLEAPRAPAKPKAAANGAPKKDEPPKPEAK